MKRIIFLLCLAGVFILSCNEKDKVIQMDQLPSAGEQFISTHFPNTEIYSVIKEGTFSPSYKIFMQNGMTVELNRKGEWTEVDMKLLPVPDPIIPTPIKTYISERFPDEYIVKLEKDSKETDVKLSNGLELTFNKNNQLIEVDD